MLVCPCPHVHACVCSFVYVSVRLSVCVYVCVYVCDRKREDYFTKTMLLASVICCFLLVPNKFLQKLVS